GRDGEHHVGEYRQQTDDGQNPAQRPEEERIRLRADEVLRRIRIRSRKHCRIAELFEHFAFDGGRAFGVRLRVLAEASLDRIVDRGGDLGGDVGTRALGQMTDDVVDVDFGERTHGVPSFQSFVMLESSSSHWEWSAAATSAPLAVTV